MLDLVDLHKTFARGTVNAQVGLDGLSLHLADLEPHEAERVGPELLDRYLARVIDPPVARSRKWCTTLWMRLPDTENQ